MALSKPIEFEKVTAGSSETMVVKPLGTAKGLLFVKFQYFDPA